MNSPFYLCVSEELMFKDCEEYADEERELLGNILHNSNELLRLVGTINRLKENLKKFSKYFIKTLDRCIQLTL